MEHNFFNVLKQFPQFNNMLGAGLIIFARFLAFSYMVPVLGRKDIPMMIRVFLSMIMTVIFTGIINPGRPPESTSLVLAITLNATFGFITGYITRVIFEVTSAAGDMINMQMGLSSAVMFDPSSREQISIMGKFFSFLGTLVFIQMGGIFWLISGFKKGFEIFPVYSTSFPLDKIINMHLLIEVTGNVLFIGLQIAAPLLIATLAMDIMLGIISKVAPQINVFQLSFLFKPLIGMAIIMIILPVLISTITNHFLSYANIF